MAKFALYAHLKAKPWKARRRGGVSQYCAAAGQAGAGTGTWYACAEDEGSYGIFDTFDTDRPPGASRRPDRQGADGQGRDFG